MKYQIELALTQRSRGKVIFESPTREGAECLSRYLKASDVADWRLEQGSLTVLSITPALEAEDSSRNHEPPLPDEVLEAMRQVVDYLYEDAAEDYPTAENRDGHIFLAVATLDSWIGGPEIRQAETARIEKND